MIPCSYCKLFQTAGTEDSAWVNCKLLQTAGTEDSAWVNCKLLQRAGTEDSSWVNCKLLQTAGTEDSAWVNCKLLQTALLGLTIVKIMCIELKSEKSVFVIDLSIGFDLKSLSSFQNKKDAQNLTYLSSLQNKTAGADPARVHWVHVHPPCV